MIRADQKAVAHTANINIIQLRKQEVDYFISFFTNFGTQSAVVTSIVFGNIQIAQTTDCHIGWLYLYWIGTTLSIIFSVKSFLAALYISVYGDSLALRGPIGSMVKAVDGMAEGQKSVVSNFLLSIIFLTFSSFGIYFMIMPYESATVCVILTILGCLLCYENLFRIYNKFKFNEKTYLELHDMNKNDYHRNNPYIPRDHKPIQIKSKSKIKQYGKSFNKKSIAINNNVNTYTTTNSNDEFKTNVYMADYITMKIKNENITNYLTSYLTNQSSFTYKRRYIVLCNKIIHIYKNKKSYDNNPESPLRKRPIDLDGLKLEIPNYELENDNEPFKFYLVPVDNEDDRNVIELRCDTLAESIKWIDILHKAISLTDYTSINNNNSSYKDEEANKV